MRIYRQLADLPANFGPSVATIGNFDGVHRGHQWVIAEVVARARQLNQTSVAITFDPHPARVLRPDSVRPMITPLSQKLELLEATQRHIGEQFVAIAEMPVRSGRTDAGKARRIGERKAGRAFFCNQVERRLQ